MSTDKSTFLRECVPYKPCDDVDILCYTAGLIDADGTIGTTGGKLSLIVSVTQAEAGWPCLELLWNTFGGSILKQLDETETSQACFMWNISTTSSVISFLRSLEMYLVIKKREALLALQFPEGHLKIIPIRITHIETCEVRIFDTAKDAAKYLNKKTLKVPKDRALTYNGYTIESVLTENDITLMKQKRQQIGKDLKLLHHKVHDDIPNDLVPKYSYIAGFFDGEATFDSLGKSSQEVEVPQKHKPILEMFYRIFGGSLSYSEKLDKWTWSLRTCDNVDHLIRNIHPFLKGKKQQAEMLIKMKPGEGPRIHAAMRELKGRHNAPTPLIDKINASGGANDLQKATKGTASWSAWPFTLWDVSSFLKSRQDTIRAWSLSIY